MFENKKLLIGIVIAVFLAIVGPIVWGLMNTPEPPARFQGPRDLVIWNLYDEDEVFTRLIQDYRVENPTVNISYKRFNNLDRYQELLFSEMAEGKGPDIFVLHNTAFLANKEKMIPMPKGFLGITPADYQATFVPAAYEDLVFDEVGEVDGEEVVEQRIYGVPLYVDNLALYYNQDLLEQYANSAFPSGTWTGLVSQVRNITQKRGGAIALSAIALGDPFSIHRTPDIYALLLLQFGAQFYDDALNPVFNKSVAYQGDQLEAASEALSFIESFANSRSQNFTWEEELVGTNPSKEISAFVKGDVAMIFGYSYYADLIDQARVDESSPTVQVIPKNVIKVAPAPQVEVGEDEIARRLTLADYYPFAVSRNAKNPEEAWNFLFFLINDTQMTHYFDQTGKPVSKRNLIDSLALTNPQSEVFLKQALDARSADLISKFEFDDNLRIVLSRMLSRSLSADEGVSLLQEILRCQSGQYRDLPEFQDIQCRIGELTP